MLLRSIAVTIARVLPRGVKQWVHGRRSLDRLARRSFASLSGAGSTAVIAGGPLAGVKLVTGEHVSHAHLNGTYEEDVLRAVDREVRAGDVCYDLGASIGYLSLLMARRARQVYAFEPAPHAAAEIRRHSAANGFAHIEVVGLPVSDRPRNVTFALTDVAYGSAIVDGKTQWPTLDLTATTLDQFAQDHELPDFVKIDVEGEEGRVLEGARTLLERGTMTWCIELHNAPVARHVLELLEAHGYVVETLDGQRFAVHGDVIAGDVQIVARAPRRPAA
ncbi:FkbM family methyltransferase [Roseisolibacter agri]|uniref:FkbM family methyltransferase n=1 Tax=Roseisolibacter agri TaxID=2014610 RepID=UPI0024E04A44|nr:FkbM family methyltransferase [Roseisolibacter agri]